MKKEKISIEEYSNILSSIELTSIVLNECSVKKFETKGKERTVNLDVSMKLGFGQDNSCVSFLVDYKLEGTRQMQDSKEKVFSIIASFLLTYIKKKDVDVSKDFVDIFKKNSIELVSWPYFREFVQNTISRMGMPTLTLPSKFFND